jgi:hypothetical protein
MSDTETNEVVDIDLGDAPEAGKVEVAPANVEIVEAPAEKKTPRSVENALEKLNKRLEEERQARLAAENRAMAAEQKVHAAYGEVSDTNIHLVASAIDSVKRDQEALKAHLRDAMAVGDFDRAAELQAAMTANFNKLNQLETGFEEMKNAPRPAAPPPPLPSGDNLVDDLIGRVTPRSAEWLRQNKSHLPDARAIRIMARAHEDAVDYGMAPESDEYFRFVEDRLGISGKKSAPEREDAMSDSAKVVQKRSSPPSAPVSRQPAGSPPRSGVVQLTREEVEAARISGITPQEYYMNKIRDKSRLN